MTETTETSQATDYTSFELLDDGVALITMKTPFGGGAAELSFLEELKRADNDAEVRTVVITGTGTKFCVGGNFSRLTAPPESVRNGTEIPHPMAGFGLSVRKPVVAAINGSVGGIGLVYILTCDVRFVAAGAKITSAFTRRALVAERSLSWLLPRVVGFGNASELALSGRVISAEEAYEIGLVNRVLPQEEVLDAAVAWARDVAQHCAPSALAVTKRQLQRALTQDLTTNLREANAAAVAALNDTEQVTEGVSSFLERRRPNFRPLAPRPAGEFDEVSIDGS